MKNAIVKPIQYENIKEVLDLNKYQDDVRTNNQVDNGVILSPYYKIKIDGNKVDLYATRTTNTIHSFLYLSVSQDSFTSHIEIEINDINKLKNGEIKKIEILPLKNNIKPTFSNDTISFDVSTFGSYSVVLNEKQDEAITLFFSKELNKDYLFEGKEIKEISPIDCLNDTKYTFFEEENKVYYFKKGRYTIDRILIPSNSTIYFEDGVFVDINPLTQDSILFSKDTVNVKVVGHALFDYSSCKWKGSLAFVNVCNLEINGLMVIGSPTWTLFIENVNNTHISDLMFFGYRTFSDGVMISDSKHVLVENSFMRTGDDAFETKSTSKNGKMQDVVFKNNAAWTDKAVAYGCIYESNHDTTDVKFIDCSVGFASSNWSKHLGSCVIQMGDRIGATIKDILFENFEIYDSINQAIINLYIGGSGGQGFGYGTIEDIHFNNIKCYHNHGYIVNVRTYDSKNCFINKLYLNNVVSNDIHLNDKNVFDKKLVCDDVVNGFDYDNFIIDKEV